MGHSGLVGKIGIKPDGVTKPLFASVIGEELLLLVMQGSVNRKWYERNRAQATMSQLVLRRRKGLMGTITM